MTAPAQTSSACCRVDRWLFGCAAVLALTLDLWSKSAAFAWVNAQIAEPRVVLIPGWFDFIAVFNTAGVWSVGRGVEHSNAIIACVGALVVGFVVLWAWSAFRPTDRWIPILAGFILGGALGNLHDRCFFPGVRDFIQIYFWGWPYPTFNVADSFVVASAILVTASLWFADGRTAETELPNGDAACKANASAGGA